MRADCKLQLDISESDESLKLRFTQPPFGGYISTIITSGNRSFKVDNNPNYKPSWLVKCIFWLTSGLHRYKLRYRIVNDLKPFHYANFYSCIDRKGRKRILADISDSDPSCGSTFILELNDYEEICSQLNNSKL